MKMPGRIRKGFIKMRSKKEEEILLDEDKGYVIRSLDLFDGRVVYRGKGGKLSSQKDAFMTNDTYTFAGAKKALANIERMSDERYSYSIERLGCYYFDEFPEKRNNDHQKIFNSIEHAMIRLDELWEGNDFDRGDKMRINEVRDVFRYIKAALLDQ